jgi:PPOX class probable F420-dependent enzyme
MSTPTESKRAQIETFLAQPRNAMVAGLRRDGRPQMTPNWFFWDGERFYVSTTRTRRKYVNFRRDPRVQLAIDDSAGFRCVLVDGVVDIWEDHQQGLPYFRLIRLKHRGQVPDDQTLLEGLAREQRVLLVITPDKPPEEWTYWSN